MSSRSAIRDRYSFANLDEVLELPDLIAIQRESFEWFLEQGLAETFRDISPIKDFTETLQLELEFDPDDEDLRPPPKFSVEECKEKDMTFSAPIFVRARFMNADHRRDQGADGLHGGLPHDDRQGHLRHQRHRACRRVPARPLAGRHLPAG